MASELPCSIDYCAVRGGMDGSLQLLVSGWAFDSDDEVLEIGLTVGGRAVDPARIRWGRGSRADVSRHFNVADTKPWGFVLVADVAGDEAGRASIEVRSRRRRFFRALQPIRVASLRGWMNAISPYLAGERAAARALVARPEDVDVDHLVADDLQNANAFPVLLRAGVDFAWVSPDQGSVYLRGWFVDPSRCVTSIVVRVGGRRCQDIVPYLARAARPDVVASFDGRVASTARPGFACHVPLEGPPSTGVGAQSVELLFATPHGVLSLTVEPSPIRDPLEVTKELLYVVQPADTTSYGMLEHSSAAAVERACEPRAVLDEERVVHSFGSPLASPRVTLLIPLFGRYDFVYYQLACFSSDREIAEQDVIYIVDDPAIHAAVVMLASAVQPVYGVPFRVVYAGRNLGFAGANNLGASIARAPRLLLLNSDVLPESPGWLGRFLHHADTLPSVGILGARLLFHDGTIQHDGMRILPDPLRPGLFWNDHPGKGLPPSFMPSDPVEACPLLTGACMLVERAIYDQVGGLDEGFVLGDFEDSDFCLKVLALGRVNYLVRDVVLRHLERQSQNAFADTSWRAKITLYNGHRYGTRWRERLEELVAAAGATS